MECIFCSSKRLQPLVRPTTRTFIQSRAESSLRRTKTALRIPPHPSFAPSPDTLQDHIIYNPPSSAPNEYHTPLKFLPLSDPRRRILSLRRRDPTTAISATATDPQVDDQTQSAISPLVPDRFLLPPALKKPSEKKYHLTPADVEEIRRLRTSDPRSWTVARLAEKFGCGQFFIGLCTRAPAEVKKEIESAQEAVKARWGRQKREAREDRRTRKDLWGRVA